MKGSVHCEASEAKIGMQRIHNIVRRDTGAWALLLTGLSLCLCAAISDAQTVPNVVISQATQVGTFQGGGALAQQSPSGNSFALDAAGNLYSSNTYSNAILEFPAGATTSTALGSFSNPSGVAMDSAGNLYISSFGSPTIIKIPVVAGTLAAISSPSGSTPPCTGNDTAECALPVTIPAAGIVAMVFDSAGNLFFTTVSGTPNPNSVFECTSACLLSGTTAPTLLFSESTTATTKGSSSAIWYMGEIAVDQRGDVFFTDSLMDATDAMHGFSYQSAVRELVFSGGSYSSTPTALYTLTNSSPGEYDNQLDGVTVDKNGTVYFATQFDGIYAFPNNQGAVTTTTAYMVSKQGAKMLTTDGVGNFFVATYSNASNGDVAMHVGINVLSETASAVGSNSTASATIILNDENCSSSPTVNFSALEGTASTTEFAAATTGSCSSTNSGVASYATTVTFTPAYGGTRTATLTATEVAGPGSTGSATVTSFATGALAPPTFAPVAGTYHAVQSVTIHDDTPGVSVHYTTDGSMPTTSSTLYSGPITVSSTETINAIATSTATGVTNSSVSTAAYTITLPAATPTFSPAGGSYNAAQAVTISDATSGATIYYTTDGTTPTASSSVYGGQITVSKSGIVQAVAVAGGLPASSVGAATYVISSATNGTSLSILTNQISTLGTFAGGGALPGGSPAGNGMAVDANGNLITGNSYGAKILEFAPGATSATVLLSASGFNPGGVAIDAAGNLYLSNEYNGTITKVPVSGGTYAAMSDPGTVTAVCNGSDTAECNLPTTMPVSGIVAMTFDASGDLFFTSTDGGTNPSTVYECTAACLLTGSPAPAALYAEPSAAVAEGSASANWWLGEIAVDPWGDVFFTDSLMVASGPTSYQSTVKELTFSGGTYSSTPTTLYTMTPGSPSTNDDQVDGVAVDANGTVYFATLYDGVFAYGNNHGAVDATTEYTVSSQGAKMLTLDSKGNVYVSTHSNSAGADVAMQIAVNNINLPSAAVSGSSTASVTTILNDGACSTSPVVTFSATENGASSTEFSANTTGSCASTPTGGASFATNVSFNPTVSGVHTGVLTAVDTVNGGVGTANLFAATAGSAAASPTFSPAPGTYTSVQTVTISDTTPGATIYYTTDGTTPTTASTKYTGAITVSSSETINAVAVVSGLSNSALASGVYTLNLPLAQTPVISVPTGTYTSIQTVKISDATLGAKIYYTTDGSAPSANSTLYKSPLTVSTTQTLNAVAIATGYAPSVVATATYTMNLTVTPPTISPAGGTFTTIQTATLTDAIPNSTIYYTTDGSTPTTSSTPYSGPIQVLGSETIKAVGAASGYANSSVASAAFILNLPAAAMPTISLGSGTYTISQPVTISDTTTGATIYYTTDGSTPTTGSKAYSGALTLNASETLKAIAVAIGYSPSPVASSSFTFTAMSAGFTLATSPSSLSIPSTAIFGTVQLTVQPVGGFTGAVALSCSGLPAGASCGFSTSPVNLTNFNQPQTVTVTISTGQTAMLRHRSNPLVPEATLALALCFVGFRKRRGVQILLLAVISVVGVSLLSGCGSSGPGTSTSTVTVTATAGSLSSKTMVSVTMNH